MDVEFGTDGWRTQVDEFTTPRIRQVGQAVASYLKFQDLSEPVVVGFDPRSTSRSAAEELGQVLRGNGFPVIVPDRDTPTPIVAWTVKTNGYAGALQVTASHNPPTYNGIKFIPQDGAPATTSDTDNLTEYLADPSLPPADEWASVTESDLISPYLEAISKFAGVDLSGEQIVYDAMHGSGRQVTDRLLESNGAMVERIRCEPDATFGGSAPEPTAERLQTLAHTVEDGAYELGIANDGDADRIAVATPKQGIIHPNLLYAVLYEYLLEQNSGPAVRTVSTTYLIDRIASEHNEDVYETPVGFKHVAEAMKEYDALMGGEESGGFGITHHLRNKDGVMVALIIAGANQIESIDSRLDRIRQTYGSIVQDRIDVDCPDDKKPVVLDSLEDVLPQTVADQAVDSISTADGFKLGLDDGSWVLIRPSGTEPKLRVYAEADSKSRVDDLLEAGETLVTNVL